MFAFMVCPLRVYAGARRRRVSALRRLEHAVFFRNDSPKYGKNQNQVSIKKEFLAKK